MPLPQRTPHLQGLLIDDGIYSEEIEGRLWVAAFMIREAILIAPDNLVPAEEVLYFNNMALFIKASLDLTHQVAGGSTYRMPYIIRACTDKFITARKDGKPLGKSTLLETLSISDEVVAKHPGLVTSPLRLREDESSELFSNQEAIFWMLILRKIQSNRVTHNLPLLEMPKADVTHHRAYLWDTVYAEHHYATDFPWLCLRPSSWDPVQGIEDCRLDPREPPPTIVPMEVDTSNAQNVAVRNDSKGQAKDVVEPPPPPPDSMDLDPSADAPLLQAIDQPQGKPKRPRDSHGTVPMQGPSAPSPKSSPPPAKKQKTVELQPHQSGSGSGSSRLSTGQVEAIGSSNADDITARPRRKVQAAQVSQVVPNGEATWSNHRRTPILVQESDDSQAEGDEDEGNNDKARLVDDSGDDSDSYKPGDDVVPSEREEDQVEIDITDEEEEEKATEQQSKKVVKKQPLVALESLDEPCYNLPRDQMSFDPFSLVLPLVWFFLHPFAKHIFEEQWAPYACITCLRLGLPCIVNLSAFVGCYNCKKRLQACSLKPRVGDHKMKDEKLCWWIGLMHHIQSIIELGTDEGAIGTVPNYGTTNILLANIPDWVPAATLTFRRQMSVADIEKRWKTLQKDVIPKWKFYAMPHSVLSKLGTNRPVRPYWPDTGDNKETIAKALQILEAGRNGTLPRMFAVNVQDGYDYRRRVEKAPKSSNSKEKKKQAAGKEPAAEKQAVVEQIAKKPKTRAPKGRKKDRTPVPSQTDPDEAPVTDLEPPPSYTDDTHDEGATPQSPLPVDTRDDRPMDVTHDSISTAVITTAVHDVPETVPSRDAAPAVSDNNDHSISTQELRTAFAAVQSNVEAAMSAQQASDHLMPDILKKLQTVDGEAASDNEGVKMELEALNRRMEGFSTHILALPAELTRLRNQFTLHDSELAKAIKLIETQQGMLKAQQDVLKTHQGLLNAIMDFVKESNFGTVASNLEKQIVDHHAHLDARLDNQHVYFKGVVERIAFTDRDRDDATVTLKGIPDYLAQGAFIVELDNAATMRVEQADSSIPQLTSKLPEVPVGGKQAIAASADTLTHRSTDGPVPALPLAHNAPATEAMDVE